MRLNDLIKSYIREEAEIIQIMNKAIARIMQRDGHRTCLLNRRTPKGVPGSTPARSAKQGKSDLR